MNIMDEARRRILIKRINDAYLCAKRCESDPSYRDRFETWCDRLPEMVTSFDEVHTKIISEYLEKEDDEAFLLQDEVRQMFDNTYADILEIKCKVFPNPSKPIFVVSGSNNNPSDVAMSQPRVKLPVLSLQTFNGDSKNWLGFRDLFDRMIHNNKTLSNVEKFSYLLSTLQGPALNLVKVFPLSDTHYEEAYRALLNRYENKRHLAFTSWEAILSAKLAADTAGSLRQLLDIFSENLAILKTLELPVQNWDFILFHTLLSKLHSSTRKEFEMTVASQDIPSFEALKDFVATYCQAWERSTSVNDTSPTVASTSKSNVGKRPAAFEVEKHHNTTLLANTPNNVCLYCSKEHYTGHCPDFQALTVYQRFDTARAKQWCMNCLRVNHTSRTCKSKSNCRTCGRRHHVLLHLPPRTPQEPQGTNPSSPSQPSNQANIPTTENAVNVLANTVANDKTVLLSTVQVEVLDRWGNYQRVRVLLDSGSQANFLTEACANRLGLKKSRSAVPILGLSNTEVSDLGKVHCTVRPCGEPDRDLTFEAIVIPKVCSNMPSSKVDNKNWHMFNNITLADPNYHTPGPIDMLIGAEMWPSILCPGSIPATGNSPMALNTIYGWVLMGTVPCETGGNLSALLAITESTNSGLNAAIQRLWEIEDIPGEDNASPEDELCENIFSNTHTRDEQGRYVVDLPMKGDPPPFVDMRNIALRRFHGLEKRLAQQPDLQKSYKDFMQDYLDSGHMSKVPPEETHRPDAYFIPHHCVINENSSTTRLRVVFDASAKDKEGKSLNEFQMIGPKLQTDIAAILTRFRVHKTVFTADCVSRGLLPKQLVEHPLWFTGPTWLSKSQDCWPSVQQIPSQTLLLSEQEQNKTALVSHTASDDRLTDLLFRFPSLKKIQRTIVYVQRFIKSARKVPCNRDAITAKEMDDALTVVVLCTQRQCFAHEVTCIAKAKPLSKPMRKLSPFLDSRAILRVGGRLGNAPLNYDAKHPILLPCNHRLTNLIIQDVHETNLHPGLQTVQFLLNQRFWVLSARRAIRRCLHGCIRCFKTNPVLVQPIMANLPSTRVSGAKAFKIVGCDYAGPFNVILGQRRRGIRAQKVYLCLFVCHATKALHLEIANDLSSDAFIAALRRFIGRRGRCSHLFSDCGTNFVGAYRHLATLMKEAAETEYIAFSTHPPSGPHFLGLAEAGVKSVKAHLQRVVGSQLLTYEEFYTLVVQIEALLNSRPLCAVSSDPNDLSVLTPGHFLTLEPLTALPEASESHLDLHNRWQLLQRLHKDFWHRWHHDYLNTLMQKSKWTHNKGALSINDIVLIKEDNVKPLYWRLGRIVNVHPGSDGVVRVANVRTESGLLKRPSVKLCPLPVHHSI